MVAFAQRISYKIQKVKDSLPNHERQLETYYEVLEKIGSGISGSVHLGRKRSSGKLVALKMIHREKSSPEEIQNEISILKKCKKTTNINHLLDVFHEGKRVVLVLEHFNAGTLWSTLKEKKSLSEDEIRSTMKTLLQTVHQLHSHGITHRDIKPQNIMLNKNDKGEITANLIDFGFAHADGPRMNLACGSLPFAAPELLAGHTYTNAVDVWSLGVIMYLMFMGQTPFSSSGTDRAAVRRTIVAGMIERPAEKWGKIPQQAREIIDGLLNMNPDHRYSAIQALNSKWFRSTPVTSPNANGSN